MKKLITFLTLGALCVVAAASAARQPPKTQVLAAKNAAWACKALRTTMGTQAFLNAYGANNARGAGAMRNAFGKCVSQKGRLLRHAGLFECANRTPAIARPRGR